MLHCTPVHDLSTITPRTCAAFPGTKELKCLTDIERMPAGAPFCVSFERGCAVNGATAVVAHGCRDCALAAGMRQIRDDNGRGVAWPLHGADCINGW